MSSSTNDFHPAISRAGTQGPVTLNRACQECQRRKIKCVVLSQEESEFVSPKCSRCSKLGLDCCFLPPASRKKRKRNETRIKEMELKLEAIHRAVGEGQAASWVSQHLCAESSNVEEQKVRHPPAPSPRRESPQSAPASNETPSEATDSRISDATLGDILSRNLVNDTLAGDLYCSFFTNLAPLYPLVLVPEPSTWRSVRQNRPTLFQAVLTAASSKVDPQLSEKLFQETGNLLAKKVVLDGEKSLDLIQSLLILTTWYHPPNRFQDLKFSQYAHMAATMVMDLQFSNDNNCRVPSTQTLFTPSDHLVETCRTFLACYFLCSSMASSLRRPSMLRYGPWVEDCINILELQTFMHLNDRRLVAWTNLQRLAEESFEVVGLDQRSPINLSDARKRFVLQGCVGRVTNWRQTISEGLMNETMEMHYQMILINLHEPALHVFHDLADFRPPYTIRSASMTRRACPGPLPLEIASGLTQCISSAQTLLRTFLSMTTSTLLSVPIVTYTRMAYAMVVLIKSYISMHISPVTLKADSMRENERINPTKLLPQVLDKLDAVAGYGRFPVPMVFFRALSNVHDWFQKQFNSHVCPSQDHDTLIEPMMHMNLESSHDSANVVEKESRSGGIARQEVGDFHAPAEQHFQPVASMHWQDESADILGSSAFDGGSFLDLPPALWNIDFDDPDLKAALGI